MDRVDFVQRILHRLDQQGWEIKADAGWSDFDVEIFGSRWSHLQLATVAEPHAGRQTTAALPAAHGVVALGQGRPAGHARL